jgi:putative transposase
MGHAFHLYYHFIWATHNRDPQLFRELRPRFLELLHEEAAKRGGVPLRHNAMPDHVHLLVRLPPTVMVSDYIGQVKGAAAYRANDELTPKFKIRWQTGYGALTLRKDEIDAVGRYIDQQEAHHRGGRLSRLLEQLGPEEEGP